MFYVKSAPDRSKSNQRGNVKKKKKRGGAECQGSHKGRVAVERNYSLSEDSPHKEGVPTLPPHMGSSLCPRHHLNSRLNSRQPHETDEHIPVVGRRKQSQVTSPEWGLNPGSGCRALSSRKQPLSSHSHTQCQEFLCINLFNPHNAFHCSNVAWMKYQDTFFHHWLEPKCNRLFLRS